MYYKITNKDSEIYKKFHELRTHELELDKENIEAIKEICGSNWKQHTGSNSQQTLLRTRTYTGFKFHHPEKLITKAWKKHKKHQGVLTPNRRTKFGKQLFQLLEHGLKTSNFSYIYKILDITHGDNFTIPWMDIIKIDDNEMILLYIEEEIKNPDLIETTETEWNSIINQYNDENKGD